MLGVFASEATSFCRRHVDENVRTALFLTPELVDDRTAEARDRPVLNRNAILRDPIDQIQLYPTRSSMLLIDVNVCK
jgi:hypothetical protein